MVRASPNRRVHYELDLEIKRLKTEFLQEYGIKLSNPQASKIILVKARKYNENNNESFLPKI